MFDVLLLSVQQKENEKINSDEKICINQINNNNSDKQKFYHTAWSFINNSNGILYIMYTKEGLGRYECGDEIFEFLYEKRTLVDNILPYYLTERDDSEEIYLNLIPIAIKKEYKKSFEDIVTQLINISEQRTIMFLCNGNTVAEEIINGIISKEEFIKMFDEGNIFTNICYIVNDKGEL